MAEINWGNVSDFERYDKLDMKVGDERQGKFVGDGTFVPSKQLKDAGAKFPRDSYVFVLEIDGQRREFWVGAQSYSVVRQIKRIRDANEGKLDGAGVNIKRVSEKTDETNYEITVA